MAGLAARKPALALSRAARASASLGRAQAAATRRRLGSRQRPRAASSNLMICICRKYAALNARHVSPCLWQQLRNGQLVAVLQCCLRAATWAAGLAANQQIGPTSRPPSRLSRDPRCEIRDPSELSASRPKRIAPTGRRNLTQIGASARLGSAVTQRARANANQRARPMSNCASGHGNRAGWPADSRQTTASGQQPAGRPPASQRRLV